MIKKLLPYTKGYRLASLLAVFTIVGEVLVEVYIPYLMADIVNIGIATGDSAFIIKRGLLMILMAIASLSFGILAARFASVGSAGFAKNIRFGLFEKVQSFSFSNVDKFSTASLITRLTTDVNSVQNTYMMAVRTFIRSPLMLVAATVMAIKISPKLSLVFAFALPVMLGMSAVIMTKTFPRFKAMFAKFDAMNAMVQENLTAIRVVKSFVRGKHEDERFEFSAKEVRDYQVRAEKIIVIAMPLAQFVLYACMIAVFYIGGRQIVAGDMLSGDLISFISYIGQVLSAVMMVCMMMVMLVMSRASIARITEVLDEKPSINDDDAADVAVEDGSVEFENVSFSYSGNADNPNVESINLKIASGETIGLIGGTGSGKTTLVQLIPRLYDVTAGSVKVGGHDVREYKIKTLRESVSMVLQKNVLFSGTIKDNLRWGDKNATDEEIESACRSAAAADFITSFPEGYETELGQGGVNVSGGQKQRLCIARALISKPKIIILDDSTSAVDTATDSMIRKALREQLSGTTTIIIAQRITSVMDADRIVVMDEGRIADVGTHEELMGRSEIYREVYDSQQKGVE